MSLRIKAAPGHRVRDERSNLLPPDGVEVEALSPYWVRRQNDGEIEVTEIPAKIPASTRSTPAPKE
ncbi:MAG: DUF2635 domain-containing protein [Reyranella sp.]|nr:DUF2635 domain-containing protein [Reyranella sp.]